MSNPHTADERGLSDDDIDLLVSSLADPPRGTGADPVPAALLDARLAEVLDAARSQRPRQRDLRRPLLVAAAILTVIVLSAAFLALRHDGRSQSASTPAALRIVAPAADADVGAFLGSIVAGGSSSVASSSATTPAVQVRSWSRDTGESTTALGTGVIEQSDQPRRPWTSDPQSSGNASDRFAALRDAVLAGPSSAAEDLALLRTWATTPGLVVEGTVVDRAGRTAVALTLTTTEDGVPMNDTVLVDPETGRIRGFERTTTTALGVTTVLAYDVLVEQER